MNIELGRLIGNGAMAEVYEYGKDKVIKLFLESHGKELPELEYEKTKNAWENGLPAPRVYDFVNLNNRYGFIMEKIHGNPMMTEMSKFILMNDGMSYDDIYNSEQILGRIKETALVLFSLHKNKILFMHTLDAEFEKIIKASAMLDENERYLIEDLFKKLPKGDSVCHGDPNPGNIMETAHGYRIIDWSNAVTGNPLFDLARYVLMFKYVNLNPSIPLRIREFINKYKDRVVEDFLSEYIKLSGIELIDFDKWLIFTSISKLKGRYTEQQKLDMLSDIRKVIEVNNGL